MATPTEKDMFLQTFAQEQPTTLKVLKAFPADKGNYKPHEKSKSATELAWTFCIENNIGMAALKGPLDFSKGFPPAPATYQECVAAYEKSVADYLGAVKATPESRLNETVAFPSGPKQMADVRVMDLLWLNLMDSIHHRGQMSVYIRPAGGKVPSIYGPTADEPWN